MEKNEVVEVLELAYGEREENDVENELFRDKNSISIREFEQKLNRLLLLFLFLLLILVL